MQIILRWLSKKQWLIDLFLLGILSVAVIAFFIPLFYPTLSIFMTPDSYLSDILHFNYPLKSLLSEALKHNQLPLWTNLIGTGFPILAEGEIGTFALTNLILFKFFPTAVAFNLGYIFTFLFFAWGMYALAREFKFNRLIAFFCALVFTFNGFHIVQIPHYNHLQVFSLFPFLWVCIIRLIYQPKSRLWLAIPFIFSQQIFYGHYQYIFMEMLFLTLWWFIAIRKSNEWERRSRKIILKLGITIILALGISAIQLLPTFEFFTQSDRMGLLKLIIAEPHGLSFEHLLQFISPYILGDIRNGTYPIIKYYYNYWETFGYIGTIPLFLAISAVLLCFKKPFVKTFIFLFVILLLIALEGNSPISFIFFFAPFSWFRIHSRFLSFISLVLILLSGYILQQLSDWLRGTIKMLAGVCFIFLVIPFTFYQLFTFSTTYHPTVPISVLESIPTLYQNNTNIRVYPVSSEFLWLTTLYKHGWSDDKEAYLHLLNGATPNSLVIHDIENADVYSGFSLKNQSLISKAFHENIKTDNETKIATVSALSVNLLRSLGVTHIASPFHIVQNDFSVENSIWRQTPDPLTIYLYALKKTKPKYFLSANPLIGTSLPEYFSYLSNAQKYQEYDAFIEKGPSVPPSNETSSLQLLADSPIQKTLKVETNTQQYLIALYYRYPGWIAEIDEKRVPIYPANFTSMAILVPAGVHEVTIYYQPISLIIGTIITVISIILYLFYLFDLSLRGSASWRKRSNPVINKIAAPSERSRNDT